MRIRCSKGIRINSFHGHFFIRSTDLLALPQVRASLGIGHLTDTATAGNFSRSARRRDTCQEQSQDNRCPDGSRCGRAGGSGQGVRGPDDAGGERAAGAGGVHPVRAAVHVVQRRAAHQVRLCRANFAGWLLFTHAKGLSG